MKMLSRVIFAISLIFMIGFPSFPGYTEESVFEAYQYVNITTATTTAVKSNGGNLAGILVNGGTMGAITISDNTSTFAGRTVATISSPYAGQVIPFGIACVNGITVVTAAATNLTVIYK